MTPEDREIINAWAREIGGPFELTLISTDDPRTRALQSFTTLLASMSDRIAVKTVSGEDGELPAIRIGPNISYQAVPQGNELPPFLDAVAAIHDSAPDGKMMSRKCGQIDLPARLLLFIAPHCPYCPVLAKALLSMAIQCHRVWLTVIDGVLFDDVSLENSVQSAPTLILDDLMRWTGNVSSGEIVKMIVDRDPSKMGVETLEGMLKNGEAFQVAEMMIRAGKIFPALIELMATGKWPLRLGAMVTIETIADQNGELAETIVPLLLDRMDEMDDGAKGDLFYVLGICGNDTLLPELEGLSEVYVADDELHEAVTEAISSIRERMSA